LVIKSRSSGTASVKAIMSRLIIPAMASPLPTAPWTYFWLPHSPYSSAEKAMKRTVWPKW